MNRYLAVNVATQITPYQFEVIHWRIAFTKIFTDKLDNVKKILFVVYYDSSIIVFVC